MENNYLIDKGYTAYERKKEKSYSLVICIMWMFIIISFISLSTVLTLSRENKAYKNQIEQRDNIIKALTATNNELTHDNIILSNGK
jgi:flagellar basal body-associated protein FliL